MKRILALITAAVAPLHASADTPAAGPDLAAEVAQLRREVRALQDIEAIKKLKHAYFRGLDSADRELLASLFHPDVDVHFIGGGYEWKFSGRERYVEEIAKNFNADAVAQHNGHHPEITLLSDSEAEGTWYLYDNFWNLRYKVYTYGTAFYRDRYVKVDGRWLIRSTFYKRHYEVVQQGDPMPNFTVRYLADHGRKVGKD
ncbi:MAG: nuclear transport factor 2 family protein [Rubrivivax sp.]